MGFITLMGLPAAIMALSGVITPLLTLENWPFWLGLIGVFILWFTWWRHTRWARFVTTIEHESLHAIVAMLSLIPVRELKVREDGSGHVLFEPPGHWLLYLSPYFIPLLLLIEIGLIRLLQLPVSASFALYGAVLGLSLLGHLRQIHPRQTDFKHAGILFSIVFLPTAFLLAYGVAFIILVGGGPDQAIGWTYDWGRATSEDIMRIWELIRSALRG